jgi:UDP:flavonoid glycosyltransferase YjiC (YdhE family)
VLAVVPHRVKAKGEGAVGRATRRAWNRWLWKTGNAIVDRVINTSIADALRAAKLPKVRNFFSRPAERVLVTVSDKLFRPPHTEIDARFRFTGYFRWQSAESPTLDAELREFTADVPGGKVPVLTFGSMVYEQPGVWMERFIRSWPRDRKIIVQRGWAQFPQFGDAPNIRIIGKVSHDQLFKHASAIIHHGGAGTTASALHAGVPQIVVPHIGDRSFSAPRSSASAAASGSKKQSGPSSSTTRSIAFPPHQTTPAAPPRSAPNSSPRTAPPPPSANWKPS